MAIVSSSYSYLYTSVFIFSLIGLPEEESWPSEVAVPQSAFHPRQPQPIEDVVPDIDELGKDLLLVSQFIKI